jgi:ABC-type Na+ transport system ATPase subunit NatA
MTDMVSVDNLVLVYSDGTRALNSISFKVREGEFFGLLGPNSADAFFISLSQLAAVSSATVHPSLFMIYFT